VYGWRLAAVGEDVGKEMLIEDLLGRVAAEPERTVRRTVWRTPPEVLAKAAQPGGLRVTELLAARGEAEQRDVRYQHVLGSPASAAAIEAWESERPLHPLPADLRTLVMRINGIHLWADETGRSYSGLAPVEEWELARIKMYGSLLDDRYVALSYHEDGASCVGRVPASGA
jgi:hypothetical protein